MEARRIRREKNQNAIFLTNRIRVNPGNKIKFKTVNLFFIQK
jgi:hypothetical protein